MKLPLDALLGQLGGSFWLPPPKSTTAHLVDQLFYFILGISIFFFALIVLLMVLFVLLYHRRPGVRAVKTATHSTPLELTWSGVPLVLVIVIFAMGFNGYLEMRTPPANAYEIQVIAKQWSWTFQYPNGYKDNNLHVPVDRPVLLVMTSDDVIHSLFIPYFRLKMDVVPGRYTRAWFHALDPGEYDLYCAEYCGGYGGRGHSDMLAKVVVHPPGEFEKWLQEAGNLLKRLPPAEAGRELYLRNGCAQCHSVDGTILVGPSFKGIFGQTHQFEDGTSAPVDENYIRESIVDPGAKVRKGFKNQMPTFQGRLSDQEITAIIAYIKSLQ
jgi:cytochrome c oxidase subunit 2